MNKKTFLLHAKGFTLIELLIVIVIIGILSTFVISNFIGIRERARDAQRKTDLRQIQTALQLYYSDEGYFPEAAEMATCATPLSAGQNGSGALYMKEIPCDPLKENNDEKSYRYSPYFAQDQTCTNLDDSRPCVNYELTACLENENDAEAETVEVAICPKGYGVTVTNP